MTTVFSSVFTGGTLTLSGFLIALAAALILGAVCALVYSFHSAHTRGFLSTLALLPAIVAVIIMMVSGSIGHLQGVGEISLVRFISQRLQKIRYVGGAFHRFVLPLLFNWRY